MQDCLFFRRQSCFFYGTYDTIEEKELALLMYNLMQKNSCFGFEAANHYYFNKGMLIEKMLSCTQMENNL